MMDERNPTHIDLADGLRSEVSASRHGVLDRVVTSAAGVLDLAICMSPEESLAKGWAYIQAAAECRVLRAQQ